MHGEFPILVTLTIGLSAAVVLGFVTQKLKLSPILGYLIAGVAVGPQTPGFVADPETAAQFAEIGVILLMFGVGMHFDIGDLWAVRRVAVPGAIGQVFAATLLGALAMAAAGVGWAGGLVVGLAISVASTVVLIRVLSDNDVLQSDQGHIAVGWLIVEDIFTVFVLVLLPAIASIAHGGHETAGSIASVLGLAVVKIVGLGLVVLWGGRKLIPRLLGQMARTRTRELFTLTILALALSIAVGSAMIFGVSMALGAFLAGMVVAQSEVSHQAAADALPMRDAFAVLFFVSVGMLFDPQAIAHNPGLFAALLGIILIAKPVSAIAIVWALGYSPRTALTVAIGLAQIGEFSFIVADLAAKHQLIARESQSLLVACAIVSIMFNPLLFRGIPPIEAWLRRRRRLWRALTVRSESRGLVGGPFGNHPANERADAESLAIIVGYGPVGRTAASILRGFGVKPIIIDLNVDTVRVLLAAGESAIYGDAGRREVLRGAGIESAKYLLITIPDVQTRTVVMIVARELNPGIKIFVRARYLAERAWLEEVGATDVCFEEAETAIGLASLLLHEVGASEEQVRSELQRIRAALTLQPPPSEAIGQASPS
ncbi:MAG: cation:proton antiporter [Planctomycetales bacterium]